MLWKSSAAVAAIALVALTVPAAARPNSSQPDIVVDARGGAGAGVVAISERDLADSAGQYGLIRRIKLAADTACKARGDIELNKTPGYDPCRDALVAEARDRLPSRVQLAQAGGSLSMILR